MAEYDCDFCGADREWNKQCPECHSKKRPSKKKPSLKKLFPCCEGECDCHMFIGGSGKSCPECSSNLNNTTEKE